MSLGSLRRGFGHVPCQTEKKDFFLMLKWRLFSILETQIMIFIIRYAYVISSTKCRETFPRIHVIIRQIFYSICQENELLFEFFKITLSESPEYSIILLKLSCNVKMSLHNFQMMLSWLPISKSMTWGIFWGRHVFIFFWFMSPIFENHDF